MLDSRAIATLGIGYGAGLVARIGLFDVAAAPPPDFIPGGYVQPGKKTRLRHAARADTLLELRCAVRSEARLVIAASAAVDLDSSLDATARLSLSASALIAAQPAVSAEADARDVVLEMLLLAD